MQIIRIQPAESLEVYTAERYGSRGLRSGDCRVPHGLELARTAGLIAHLHEELQRPIGFILSHHAADAIAYDGAVAQAGS